MKIIAIPAEVYSRVVGYYRPVQDWNRGKKEEYGDRHQMGRWDVVGMAGHNEPLDPAPTI